MSRSSTDSTNTASGSASAATPSPASIWLQNWWVVAIVAASNVARARVSRALICFADFPTEKITAVTRAYRQLGIGYANLGALLMATGHAYDSEGGRAIAAAITSLMTGTAYRRSAELAAIVGTYDGYERNASAHKRVMSKHADACGEIKTLGGMDREIHTAAAAAWKECLALGEANGYRNAQAQPTRANRHNWPHDGL